MMTQVSRAIRTSRSNAQATALVFPSNIFATALPTVPMGIIQILTRNFIHQLNLILFLIQIDADTTKIYASALQVSRRIIIIIFHCWSARQES